MSETKFANIALPAYYAVIFSSQRSDGDNGYGSMADKMIALASSQSGFLGYESVRGTDGFGITVSYWLSKKSIADWKKNIIHQVAQEKGKQIWYEHYEIKIAKVERAYGKLPPI